MRLTWLGALTFMVVTGVFSEDLVLDGRHLIGRDLTYSYLTRSWTSDDFYTDITEVVHVAPTAWRENSRTGTTRW